MAEFRAEPELQACVGQRGWLDFGLGFEPLDDVFVPSLVVDFVAGFVFVGLLEVGDCFAFAGGGMMISSSSDGSIGGIPPRSGGSPLSSFVASVSGTSLVAGRRGEPSVVWTLATSFSTADGVTADATYARSVSSSSSSF